MDNNMLEFFGKALLNAAHGQKQLEEINKNIEKIAAENPFIKIFFKSYDWQNKGKMKDEDITLEFTEKSFAAFKEFMKSYLTIFDVVPKEEHLSLIKENEDLKAKIAELEKIINNQKYIPTDKDSYNPEKIMENLTQIMSNQTNQFKELMKQLNQPYKTTAAKKKL
ncbi:MAG: hypothetical protein ABFD75_03645 [Smithella sp.]